MHILAIRNVLTLAFLCFFISACGKHFQTAFNSGDQVAKKDTAETNPNKLIFESLSAGNLKEVKAFLDSGVDINVTQADGKTLLIVAVQSEKYAIVRFLVEIGADTSIADKLGKTAIDYGDKVMIKLLQNIPIASEELNEIYNPDAITNLKLPLINFALEEGADINYVNPGGKTALIELVIVEAEKGSEKQQKKLAIAERLASDPAIDFSLKFRRLTALGIANRLNHPEVAAILRKHGATR